MTEFTAETFQIRGPSKFVEVERCGQAFVFTSIDIHVVVPSRGGLGFYDFAP